MDPRSLLKGKLRSLFAAQASGSPSFAKADYERWKQIHTKQDDRLARESALDMAPWIEILFRAAAQPQKRKFWQVRERLVQSLDECREEFRLGKTTDNLISEYASSSGKITQADVKQLRKTGVKKKDLPQIGEEVSLAWSPGSDSLTARWLLRQQTRLV